MPGPKARRSTRLSTVTPSAVPVKHPPPRTTATTSSSSSPPSTSFRSRIAANPDPQHRPHPRRCAPATSASFSPRTAAPATSSTIPPPRPPAPRINTDGLPCRYQFGYGPSAPVGANGASTLLPGATTNIIPKPARSPPSPSTWHKFLPAPLTSSLTNNFASGVPSGYDNFLWSARIDYTHLPPPDPLRRLQQRQPATPSPTPPPLLPASPSCLTSSPPSPPLQRPDRRLSSTPSRSPRNLVNQARYGFIYFGGPPVDATSPEPPTPASTASPPPASPASLPARPP